MKLKTKRTNFGKKKKRAEFYIQIVLFSMILVFQLIIIGNQNCMMTMQSQFLQNIATLQQDRAALNDPYDFYSEVNERGE